VSREAKKAQTTVSHLHDGTVLQFSKILHHILKSTRQNLELTKGFTLRHKNFVLVLYTTRSFRAVCAIACWLSLCRPHTIMSFLKSGIHFHFFFLRHRNPFDSHTPTRELTWQKYWFYCRLLVQCTSTVKITKNHLLVYKIAFVAFELRFKKCCHDHILFLADGRRSKPVYHHLKQKKRWLHEIVWAALVRVCRLVM